MRKSGITVYILKQNFCIFIHSLCVERKWLAGSEGKILRYRRVGKSNIKDGRTSSDRKGKICKKNN